MTDADRGFISTPVVSPISYVRYTDDDERDLWLVYVFGTRTGSIQFGHHTCYYRSVSPDTGGRMFIHFSELRDELERIVALIAVVNSELCNGKAAA